MAKSEEILAKAAELDESAGPPTLVIVEGAWFLSDKANRKKYQFSYISVLKSEIITFQLIYTI